MSWSLVDVADVHGIRDDLLVSLKENAAVSKIIKERDNCGLHVQTVEPQCEYSGLALSLRIKVFDFELLLFSDGIKGRVVVEEIGDKSQVKLGVSCNK
jgi:hypothetical protein